MFFRILRKDLKRKKTMNIILLVFIILASTFAISGTDCAVSVFGGLDYYMEKADAPDYVVLMRRPDSADQMIEDLSAMDSVSNCKKEEILFFSSTALLKNNERVSDVTNAMMAFSINDVIINYFDRSDHVIKEVAEGEVYITGPLCTDEDFKIGDTFELKLANETITLKVAGYAKDAIFGTSAMGNSSLIMNDADYRKIRDAEGVKNYLGTRIYLDTTNVEAVKDYFGQFSVLFDGDIQMLKTTYIMDMIVAGMVVLLSIGLLLIAFVLLGHTIKYSVVEEFREIGVMKAVGLKSRGIRGLYLVKYLGLAIVGTVIGFFLSIPFEHALLEEASRNMVFGNDNLILIRIIMAIVIVAVVLLFCYHSTRKVKKLSPVDAMRNGMPGERYHKKGLLSLAKSHLPFNSYMAANDITASPRQYSMIVLIFAMAMVLIMVLANTANTLKSGNLVPLLSTTKSDMYMTLTDSTMDAMASEDPHALIHETEEIERILAENDMPANVFVEVFYKYPVEFNGRKTLIQFLHCPETKTTDYEYTKGYAPENKYEIALGEVLLKELGAEIGDKVWITINGVREEYRITASMISLSQLGQVGRLHPDVDTHSQDISSGYPFQIDFDEKVSEKEMDQRFDRIRELFQPQELLDADGFVESSTKAAPMVSALKNLLLIITIGVIFLMTALMERSFISRERREIALSKALGVRSRDVLIHHALRFMFMLLISLILAIIFCVPATHLMDAIFAVMGAGKGIQYKIVPMEVFVVYPLILLGVTVAAAFLTVLYTKHIQAVDTADVE